MSSVISGIYMSKKVHFALGSYKFNAIKKVDASHRETLNQYFVILITACQADFSAGFQICANITWQHDEIMTWMYFQQYGPFVKGQFMGLLMQAELVMRTFGGSLSLDLTSFWTNSRIAGDLRRNVTNSSSV